MSRFSCAECCVVIALGEVNLGQCMPSLKRVRVCFNDIFQFIDCRLALAESEVEGGVIDLILKRSVAHGCFVLL